MFGSDVCAKTVDQLDVGFMTFFLCDNTGKNLKLCGFCLVENVSTKQKLLTNKWGNIVPDWMALSYNVDKLATSLNEFLQNGRF